MTYDEPDRVAIYGFSLAMMFAPLHECSHRTAFATNQINHAVTWFAGLLSFYNSTFYRLYHKWHHRYTQIPGKDPELSDRKPTNISEYILEISGFYWWTGKIRGQRYDNNAYTDPLPLGTVKQLPANLLDALRYLHTNTILPESLGVEFVQSYIKLKQREWNEYST
jgi:hypothetical protein